MIAGTIAVLRTPADEPLESQFNNGRFPALDVDTTQGRLNGHPIQSGRAATRVTRDIEKPEIGTAADSDDQAIITMPDERVDTVLTEWVADATGTGLLAASSVEGRTPFEFPWALFYNQTGIEPEPRRFDVADLHRAWEGDDDLADVWLTAGDDEDGASIAYHERAGDDPATIGLGFKRHWGGTIIRGVVYESGYVALYNTEVAETFAGFVAAELLPFAYTDEDDIFEQETLGDDAECERCGQEEDLNDDGYCVVCQDYIEEHGEEGSA